MSSTSLDDLGKLILRLTIGILVLLHGIAKLQSGVGGIAGMLSAHGLPAFIAWGAYIGEVIGPLLLIAGFYTRVGAIIVAINMLFAIGLAHVPQLFTLGKSGGWALELQGCYLFGSIAILCLGAGAYSLGGRNGRWN